MTLTSRNAAFLVIAAAGLMPTGAQAQWYQSGQTPPPLYPYAVQSNQPYAIQVSPNTYVIQRPGEVRQQQPHLRNRSAAIPLNKTSSAAVNVRTAPPKAAPVRTKVDQALVEELSNRHRPKSPATETTQVVRDKPVVVETKRYVDDPPRVVDRYVDAEGRPIRSRSAPVNSKRVATAVIDAPVLESPKGKDDVKRVINAEAEITILGPDRMNIRLYRKGSKSGASAD